MIEWSAADLREQLAASRSFILFLHSPLCGTCKLAGRMLETLIQANPAHRIHKCNINFVPHLAQEWQVQSIPCLLIVRSGIVTDRMYAMPDLVTIAKFVARF